MGFTEGDSWFSYPLNANIADYIDMMSDFSSGTGFRRLAENHWRPILKAQFSGRGFD